jgi:predicted Zn-ribbon and HTH transcriptional regulator
MYRQAAIRCQKAKRWQDAREWARRGLDVYGEQAARPEVVEDLHKRLAHSESKIAETTRPQKHKPRAVAVAVGHAPEIETFVCLSCGGTFERERTRGRKPSRCPTCRATPAPVVAP